MKVLMVNGSSHKSGCTYTALSEIAKSLEENGVSSEIIQLGGGAYHDCIACGKCADGNKCAIDDIVNEIIEKAKDADGFIWGSPVYYAHPTGRILSVLDRVFRAGGAALAYKPGAAIASARRGGTTATFDVLNKYYTLNNMPVVSSNYWNIVHGNTAEEVKKDEEGMQIMQVLGKNMAWLIKTIEAGKKAGVEPDKNVVKVKTNFIR